MIQLNLLPDVKLEYLRTTRNKRLVIGVSLLLIAVSVGALLLMLGIVHGFQKLSLNNLDKDIVTYNQQLKNTPDLDKKLTIQNQLSALTTLHEGKVDATRLFGYVTQLTPTAASISELSLDAAANSMTITGSADALDAVNTYVDTLKFTTYQVVGDDGSSDQVTAKAFSGVVLTQFARTGEGASYTITATYDPKIFNNTAKVKLAVPSLKSTRSLTEQRNDLFKASESGGQ